MPFVEIIISGKSLYVRALTPAHVHIPAGCEIPWASHFADIELAAGHPQTLHPLNNSLDEVRIGDDTHTILKRVLCCLFGIVLHRGETVSDIGFVVPDEGTPFHEWAGYSPDGFTDDGIIEIKCPLAKTHFNYIEANELPGEYKWQVQGGLWICEGKKYCDFMSYYPGLKPFIIRIYPDKEAHKKLSERMIEFIKEIDKKLNLYNDYSIY